MVVLQIFGAYKLHIYGTDLNFFVMNNIFLTRGGETINEKYDLKGSWVARNAKPPRDGQRVPCTFCNQTFVYHRRNLRQGNLKKPSFAVRASKDAQDTDEQVVHGDADRYVRSVDGKGHRCDGWL